MIKQYLNFRTIFPIAMAFLFIFISSVYPDYTIQFTYLYFPLLAAFVIYDLIKKKKEDKINGTSQFKDSILRMLIIAGILLLFYFFTT